MKITPNLLRGWEVEFNYHRWNTPVAKFPLKLCRTRLMGKVGIDSTRAIEALRSKTAISTIFFSKKGKCLYVAYQNAATSTYTAEAIQQQQGYPSKFLTDRIFLTSLYNQWDDALDYIPEEYIQVIAKDIDKRANALKSSKERRDFESNLFRSMDVKIALAVGLYLNDPWTTSYAHGFNTLNGVLSWGHLKILQCIAPDEFLAGVWLSSSKGEQGSTLSKASNTIRETHGIKVWPSNSGAYGVDYSRVDKGLRSFVPLIDILDFVLSRLRVCYYKIHTAKKYSSGFRIIFDQTIRTYRAALQRWPEDRELCTYIPEIEEMIATIDNPADVKQRLNAKLMQHRLTGGAQ